MHGIQCSVFVFFVCEDLPLEVRLKLHEAIGSCVAHGVATDRNTTCIFSLISQPPGLSSVDLQSYK